MDSAHIATINKTPITFTRNVYFNAPSNTDTITEGMALCWDVTAAAVNRNVYVTKPTLLNSSEFCGIVAPGVRQTGSGWVEVLIADGVLARGVNVHTDEYVVNGDLLGVIPGSYALGKCIFGNPVAEAIATYDGNTTPGLVPTHFGLVGAVLGAGDLERKIVRYFDHFIGNRFANSTADTGGNYLLSGTSAAATFADSSTAADQATAAQRANGVMSLTSNSTNQANITINGEPFSIAGGQSLFLRARVAQTLPASPQMFLGVGITSTSALGTEPSNYMAFTTGAAGAITWKYRKASGTTVTNTPSVSMVASEYRELAFLVRNKAALGATGSFAASYFIDGTQYTPTITNASFPNAESLTFIAECVGGAAITASLDRIEINNYIG